MPSLVERVAAAAVLAGVDPSTVGIVPTAADHHELVNVAKWPEAVRDELVAKGLVVVRAKARKEK